MTISQIHELLEKDNILNQALSQRKLFQNILKECLEAKDEKILLLSDTGDENKRIAPMLSAAYHDAAESLGYKASLSLKDKQKSMNVREAILSQDPKSIIIANMSNKIGRLTNEESTFREHCRKKGHKFISTTSLGKLDNSKFGTIINTMDINYKDLDILQQKLKETIDEAKHVRIKTEKGTDLSIDIKDTNALYSTGYYTLPGTGGNMPGGEVYFAPKIKSVNGTVVIDGSSRNRTGTTLIKTPITITIKESQIISIEGDEEAELLKESLSWAETRTKDTFGIKAIGEFGIGTNPNAQIIGSTVIDEKTLGTAHIAIGSNHWFGGDIKANIHLDQVFHRPIIEIDGKEIKIPNL